MKLILTFAPEGEIIIGLSENGKLVMQGSVIIRMGTCSPEITKVMMAQSWTVMEFADYIRKTIKLKFAK